MLGKFSFAKDDFHRATQPRAFGGHTCCSLGRLGMVRPVDRALQCLGHLVNPAPLCRLSKELNL